MVRTSQEVLKGALQLVATRWNSDRFKTAPFIASGLPLTEIHVLRDIFDVKGSQELLKGGIRAPTSLAKKEFRHIENCF